MPRYERKIEVEFADAVRTGTRTEVRAQRYHGIDKFFAGAKPKGGSISLKAAPPCCVRGVFGLLFVLMMSRRKSVSRHSTPLWFLVILLVRLWDYAESGGLGRC